jgi:hypothetical protein
MAAGLGASNFSMRRKFYGKCYRDTVQCCDIAILFDKKFEHLNQINRAVLKGFYDSFL